MRTEEVYGRLYSGGAVLKAVETDGDEVARRLEERYGTAAPPTLPEGSTSLENATTLEEFATAFNYRKHLDHLFGDLKTVHTGLVSAEDLHQQKLMLLEELADQRDKVNDRLQDRFYKARHSLETLYSEQKKKGRRRRGYVLASITGDTPRNPRRFVVQVVQTEKFLRDPAVEPPSLELEGVKVDFAKLADDLTPLRKELETLLDAIDRVTKEAKAARQAKKKAIEEFNDVFGWVTRALESLFHLAGLHDLAELIRPSVRRKGRRAVDEEASTADGQPAEGSSAAGQPAEESAPAESTPEESASSESAPQSSPPAQAASPPAES